MGEYMCANQRCIDISRKCDFVDDCGDFSDETTHHCTNYFGCNFEKEYILNKSDPYCHFINGSGDFNWRMNTGGTTTKYTGPEHDHTLRRKDGHYVSLEATD